MSVEKAPERDNVDGDSDQDDGPDSKAQAGVQNIEAITSVWTKSALGTAFVMIWVIYFVDSMQQGTTGNLTPWVTSAFQQHSLTPTVTVMSSIIGGVFKLTLAKVLDIFGRPQGYVLAIAFTTLGLIMMAGCNNVETYAAAQVFYWVGYNGLDYSLSIFLADTTSLRNRGLIFAYSSSPYIITTWLSGPISSAFLKGPGFRWGFGSFAIITPVITLPLFFLFMHYNKKAKQLGIIRPRESKGTFIQSLVYYGREFDIVGLLVLSGGLAMFLLPFNIYSYQSDGWKSPLIIGLLVGGFVALIVFAIWERFFAAVTFIPYSLLTDRTVIGANILASSVFVSFYIWDSYFLSFLQVVNGLNVTESSYVGNIYSIGSCLWAILVGFVIRYTGKFKPICLFFGVPVTILGVGLMIHFRQPDVNIGYIIMCQIFIAFAGGTIVICEQTAAMAATSHQYVAVVLAIEAMASSIGGAVGSTVAAAVWQAVFPKKLGQYLPESAQGNLTDIYGSLDVQLSYPMGSPERIAIQQAYGDSQKMMLIAGTAVLSLSVVGTAMWRNIDVREHKQVKGTVF
ncbi:major facilitator superfamily domain-containing protein [Trichoderma breve]|uniref:Major facilitator superfamily domain-containing protein n=1 Tax=Trichoderma breve TaxID=2034170 RepID=A0A9W9E7G9_9HYPO|nr:major facilitator superfamily domain-containing protein [Trichoderma breve]KAJ4857436.1 major facilitator superfamily domain-containing protein [Trichoderma breve]